MTFLRIADFLARMAQEWPVAACAENLRQFANSPA